MTEISETQPAAKSEWPKRIVWGVIVGGAIYAYSNWETVSVGIFGPSAYTCKNLVPQVVEISEKNNGSPSLKVIGVINPEQVSKSETRLECKGQGVFATGTKMPIAYRAYEEGEQWWIFYEAKP